MPLLSWLIACSSPCSSPFQTGEERTIEIGEELWTMQVLEAGICGPAFVDGADLDGDGAEEPVVSVFGQQRGFSLPNGGVRRLDGEGAWLLSPEQGLKWPNGVEALDVDEDGDLDLLVGLGFLTCQLDPYTAECGGLVWLENGAGWAVHELIPPGAEGFYHHAEPVDLDGDGVQDLVTAEESMATPHGHEAGSTVQWLRGLGGGEFESVRDLAPGLGGMPRAWDVDEDGDQDLVAARYFSALEDQVGFAWLEQADGAWVEHPIDPDSGPAIQASVVELGGETVLLGANHVDELGWPMVAVYRPGSDPTQTWQREVLAEDFEVLSDGPGAGAPGVFEAGDVDGDGDLDVLLSGDGDPAIYLLRHGPEGFEREVVLEGVGQGGVGLADLDGDGQLELLASSWEENVVMAFWRV